MKKARIEIYSIISVLLSLIFYFFIIGKTLPYKLYLLMFLVLINLYVIIYSIYSKQEDKQESYIAFEGFWLSVGFIGLSTFLMILEILKIW